VTYTDKEGLEHTVVCAEGFPANTRFDAGSHLVLRKAGQSAAFSYLFPAGCSDRARHLLPGRFYRIGYWTAFTLKNNLVYFINKFTFGLPN
jgi:hypothetical protein